MRSGIFGWSYPPGVTGNEPEISGECGFCDVCGQNIDTDECVCQECPVCYSYGDPSCYINHGMKRTEEQKFLKECIERNWEEINKIESEYYEDYWADQDRRIDGESI